MKRGGLATLAGEKAEQAARESSGVNYRPTSDHVLIEWEEDAAETAGGIALPETARKKSRAAKVLAAGPGLVMYEGGRGPMDFKEGDRVLVSKDAKAESVEQLLDSTKKNPGRLALVRQQYILCVIEG